MSDFNNNTYANFHKGESDTEVAAIFENEELYLDEARLAAYRTLKERGFEFSSEQLQKAAVLEQNEREVEKKSIEQKQAEQQTEDSQLPFWYSPAAIIGFGVMGSVLFGAVLLAMNFYKSNKKNRIIEVVLFALVVSLGANLLLFSGRIDQMVALIINAVASFFLIELFWKRHLGLRSKFERRSIKWPVVILIALGILNIALIIYTNPEVLAQIQNKG